MDGDATDHLNSACRNDEGTPTTDETPNRNEEAVSLETSSSSTVPMPGTIGTIQLAVIVFYSVSGGPFGIEEAVRSGGAFYSILGFALFPFVWSLPEALITAELGSSYPEASGGVVWVEEAFGPWAGWMSGALSWIGGATDNAIYPVLFLDYLLQVVGSKTLHDMNRWLKFSFISVTSLTLALINYRGLPLVGNISIAVCLLSMSPFVIFCVLTIPQIDPSRWLQVPSEAEWDNADDDGGGGFIPYASLGGVLWRPFLNNLFWNLNSFDSASALSGEVQSPGRSFPRAMFLSVILVSGCYLLPLMAALGTTDASQEDWVDGFLAGIGYDVVGPWLGAWIVFAAAISNLALFQAEMSSDAYQLMGMADRGYLPKIFSRRSRYNTPTFGIVVGVLFVLTLVNLEDLSSLIEMLNFCYAFSLLLEYAAFIKLRISKPELERPYKIPLSTTGCILFLIPNLSATLLVMALASYDTFLYGFTSVAVAALLYTIRRRTHPSEDSGSVAYEPVASAESTSLPRVGHEEGSTYSPWSPEPC